MGGSNNMHRTVYSMVCRGHGPGDAAAEVQVKRMLQKVETVLDAAGVRDNEHRGFAAHWWKNYLLLCDWMPNEQRVVIRGPSYEFLHKSVYGAVAKQAGLHLCYKTWMGCLQEGLRLVCDLLEGSDPAKLRASRSARHSKCAFAFLLRTLFARLHGSICPSQLLLPVTTGFPSAKNAKIAARIGWTRRNRWRQTARWCRPPMRGCWRISRHGRPIVQLH